MRSCRIFALLVVLLSVATFTVATTHFEETFPSTEEFESRWVISNWKKTDGTAGEWKISAGEWSADAQQNKGLQTSQDARFYAASAKFTPFTNEGKDLVLQYTVKFPQQIDCGGGYIKLLPNNVDQANFGGDSPYYIMFGPDVCGSTKRTHVIFNYKDNNLLTKKSITCETDQLTHLYTLILHPDNTYEVRIDGEKKESGSLYDDWDFLLPRKIQDPNVSKPSDWVDDPMMNDPSDVKPADWADTPRQIPDPEAAKPEDWDDEADGEWEAPMIDNPAFKGEWKPKRIANPEYKGAWEHPLIDNPEFVDDPHIYRFNNIGAVGFELWQVKSGTIFDNIIVTDSIEEADAFAQTNFFALKDAEKSTFEAREADKRKREEEERARAAEEQKKSADAESATEDDEVSGHDDL